MPETCLRKEGAAGGVTFPPKLLVGSWQAAVVLQRREALQRWLDAILSGLRDSPSPFSEQKVRLPV
jgi:hypothetical protein